MNGRKLTAAALCSIALLWTNSLLAQEASENEAVGLDVGLSANAIGIGLADLNVGPLPDLQEGQSQFFPVIQDTVLGVDVTSPLDLLAVSSGTLVGTAEFADDPQTSESTASVEDLDLDVGVLGLIGLFLGADEVVSEARITGACGDFQASGDTLLTGAQIGAPLATIDLEVSPAPNTIVDVSALGLAGITLVLNEQITAGDGVTGLSMLVNAIRLELSIDIPLVASVDGEVIVSQSHAQRNCNSAGLALTKTANPDPATVNESLVYTLTVTNNGPDTGRNVVVSDALPVSVVFQSAVASTGSCDENAGVVTCDLGELANGAVETIEVTVIPTVVGSILNTAAVETIDLDPTPDDSDDEIEINVGPQDADLQLTKTADPNPATVGGVLTYTLVVSNNGPGTAENASVTDTLDAGLTIDSFSATGGGVCGQAGQTVTCDWSAIADGASETVTINTTPTAAGTVANAAAASSDNPDPDPGGAEDSISVEVVDGGLGDADLQLIKSADPDPVEVGQTLTYTLEVTNNGPEDAENVVVTDTLDATLDIIGATASGSGNCGVTGQLVTCTWAQIANGAVESAVIETTPTEAGIVVNSAVAASDNPDPDPGGSGDGIEVSVIGDGEPPGPGDVFAIPVFNLKGLLVLIVLMLLFGAVHASARGLK